MILRLARCSFWLLLLANVVSIFGFAFFSLHPESLGRWEWTAPIFSVSYPFFARLQIILAFLCCALTLFSKVKWRWLDVFFSCVSISLASELLGTTLGIPFGAYEYTSLLGPTLFGKVPYLIPISWFFMAIPCYGIALKLLDEPKKVLGRILLGSLLLMNWDLTLDPAMSHLSPFWLWSEQGIYFGTPIKNLFGWYITGVAILGSFEGLKAHRWLKEISGRFFVEFYLANLSLPLGIVICAGLWLPVGLTALASLPLAIVWKKQRSSLRPRFSRDSKFLWDRTPS